MADMTCIALSAKNTQHKKLTLFKSYGILLGYHIKLWERLDSVDGLEVCFILLIMQGEFMCSRKDGSRIMKH
jgi:hypothetical protein